MTAFLTGALAVVTSMSTALIAFVTEQITNPVVILALGIVLFLLFYGKVIGAVKGIGGGKKRRR